MTIITDPGREQELRAGLSRTRQRIAAACHAAGRPDDVRLVVVTKTFPATDVELLAGLGVADVGENRDQEARAKRALLDQSGAAVRWHMIGQLQRNKARSVASWADVIESVDRPELALALERGAEAAGREIEVLLQVNLDPEPAEGRGGVVPERALDLAAVVAAAPHLMLRGVMGVAPHPGSVTPGQATTAARRAFDQLVALGERLRHEHPTATEVSAGMSGDLEEAIGAGATQVRVGGAILGERPRVQ